MKRKGKKVGSALCFVGVDRTSARVETYFNKSRMRVAYIVRAGRKGKGRHLRSAFCDWGAQSQSAAMAELRRALRGLVFVFECVKCGGDVTTEDVYCPKCGQWNEENQRQKIK